MCGFAGVLLREAIPPETAAVRAMAVALRHRGPDHQAAWTAPHVGLAHARLSIIDLSAAGHQPMVSGSGRTVIAFNGEIYNYRELRSALEGEGVRFRSHSDTEVLVEGIERHGAAFLSRLRGMFAFATWDTAARRLLLARDPFGIKPLYWTVDDAGTLRFGSEIKALLAYGSLARRVDAQGLSEFLWFGNTTGTGTHFAGVQRLAPGHVFEVAPGAPLAPRPYWRLEDVPPVHDDEPTATRRVAALLEDAVRSHLVADVPVGVFLSGGIDSSAITAHASRLAPSRISTYAVGFDFAGGVNELPKAARVARHFGTDHHELHLGAGDLPELLGALVRAHDEPFADAADIPLWLLCRELRGGVKVVLQGDGGDEVFAGYRRYNVAGWEGAWHPVARALLPVVRAAPAGPRQRRLARFLRAMASTDAGERSALLLTVDSPLDPPTAVLTARGRALLTETAPFAVHHATAARFAAMDAVQRALFTDLALLLPTQFLEKVDKATMAHGIEVRVPFLDLPLATYGAGLPSAMKVRALQKKYLLRQALRGLVPDDVLDGPKTGFGVPYGAWLRGTAGTMLEAAVGDPRVQALDLLDAGTIRRRLTEHRDGRRDHAFMLWKVLQLALWLVEYAPDA